jgi:mannitol-1-/sugar-/sorbitol-6-phosphatase
MTTLLAQALLFDLDGTLVDSTASVNRQWVKAAAMLGWDPAVVVGRYHGMTAAHTLRVIDPDLSDDRVAELSAMIVAGEAEDTADVVAMPGAAELLDRLPLDRWTIVTSCPPRLARSRLGAAGLPVPGLMVTAADIRASKPDPEPYTLGAARLGFPAPACLAVEDAPAGIASATAAGCQVLGIGEGAVADAPVTIPDFTRAHVDVGAAGIRVTL